MTMQKKDEEWAIERKIPLTVIFMLVAQSVGLIIWGATMSATVSAQRERLDAFENWRIKIEGNVSALQIQSTGADASIGAMRDSLSDIKASQRRIEDILMDSRMKMQAPVK